MLRLVIVLLIGVCIVSIGYSQNVGIGTTQPKTRLQVADSNVYFSAPNPLPVLPGISPLETGGAGFLWYASKLALRVGVATGDKWSTSKMGTYSASFGYDNRATGVGSFAVGLNNSIDLGADYSVAMGSYNYARNLRSAAIGNYSRSLGNYSTAIGYDVAALAYQSTALGKFNTLVGDATSDVLTDPLLMVGNGANDANRSNALVILKNGNIGIGIDIPQYKLDVSSTGISTIYAENGKTSGARNSILANLLGGPGYTFSSAAAAVSGYAGYSNSAAVAEPGGYALLGRAGTGNIAVGAFSTNMPALRAVSTSGLAISTSGGLRFASNGESNGALLVSDALGVATWQTPAKIILDNASAVGVTVLEYRSAGAYKGGIGYDGGAGRFFFYEGESSTNVLFINNGRMGIKRDATTNSLEVNGEASKSTAGSWAGNSDARLKKQIKPIDGALDKLLQLKGITYEWNDTKTGNERPVGPQMGFTAQNIQQVFPGKVKADAQGFLQTAYGDYDPLLVEAIRELTLKIESLHKRLNDLEEENNRLKKKNSGL